MLFGLAIAIGVVLAIVFIRAFTGYTVTPVAAGTPTTITLDDRDVAIWSSPDSSPSSCSSVDTSGQGSSRTSMASVTISYGDRSWHRVGTIFGPSGSTHTLTCDGSGEYGYGPNPQIGKYIALGLGGVGLAGLLALASFVIFLVTILRRQSAKRQPPYPPYPGAVGHDGM